MFQPPSGSRRFGICPKTACSVLSMSYRIPSQDSERKKPMAGEKQLEAARPDRIRFVPQLEPYCHQKSRSCRVKCCGLELAHYRVAILEQTRLLRASWQ